MKEKRSRYEIKVWFQMREQEAKRQRLRREIRDVLKEEQNSSGVEQSG